MALTRDFRETVVARAVRDPAFKTALLQEALQSFLEGEVAPGLILLRDCINASVGFAALSRETHIPEKSLMRMVGPRGNPTARKLFAMIAALQRDNAPASTKLAAKKRPASADAPPDALAKALMLTDLTEFIKPTAKKAADKRAQPAKKRA